tara:strand:- start:767 stop:943 length:177 start_codon:yes stop_codon:yes gene_type:complete
MNRYLSKKELFISQAPNFNFELNADEILKQALEVGFVTEASHDQYLINEEYTKTVGHF